MISPEIEPATDQHHFVESVAHLLGLTRTFKHALFAPTPPAASASIQVLYVEAVFHFSSNAGAVFYAPLSGPELVQAVMQDFQRFCSQLEALPDLGKKRECLVSLHLSLSSVLALTQFSHPQHTFQNGERMQKAVTTQLPHTAYE